MERAQDNTNGWTPRGLLNRKAAEPKFTLTRHMPSPDIAFFVKHYWVVRWDLRGQEPFVQENVPHPCVNLVFEKDNSRVYGVIPRTYSHTIEGEGHVLGVKFEPGGFYPFVKTSIAALSDKSMTVGEAFRIDHAPLEREILALADDSERIARVEGFLRERLPERDENVALIREIVDSIIATPDITRVDDVAGRFGIGKRSLQRLFSQYVGVGPKWTIQRYRLHEAAERLSAGHGIDLGQIASSLGYFDQAHFARDFRAMVGKSPTEYLRL